MNPLVRDILHLLRRHIIVKSVRLVNYDETLYGRLEVKIRWRLVKNYKFQVWLHYEPTYQDYAYQLFSDRPILRWDNSPHYPNISTAPHHVHDETGKIRESHLLGDPRKDVQHVLSIIAEWLEKVSKA